ncbi:SfnB family sulfur acquisition oxidoreductase [Pseudomonas sp. MAG002Y]|uniref:SfnB family sulfur acquisition oxidoreductase n=1 Tax=Pseudomonas sp. MAG002Y TaxID=2678690 RepID=UPI001C60B75C|nr:SfnB family sulfur acquisition oxidoreductase [Pseudomonas sp. MAG002Y]MBW5414473.1 SfnB family sulfur acquisition oxidoreductase [Pseudomonas sp. MAG002Y]
MLKRDTLLDNDQDVAPPVYPARILTTDAEAIAAAHELARFAAQEASLRDQERKLPWAEIERFTTSGLGSVFVPIAFGGPQVSFVTIAEIFKIIAKADPALAQIPQNHFSILNVIRSVASAEQQQRLFESVLAGWRIGNAGPERGSKHTLDLKARLTPEGDHFRLNGEKFYSTGALFAHWVTVKALDDTGRQVMAFVRRGTPGLRIIDDWSGFGQRTTASGTVILNNVRLPAEDIIPSGLLSTKPSLQGAYAQLIHAAIDAGIALSALADLRWFVVGKTRPWPEAGITEARNEPYLIAEVGRLEVELHAAEALLRKAAGVLDSFKDQPVDESQAAQASIAVAEAKVLTSEIALAASEKLFELAGSRATLAEFNLDRHWRNARTHTLHDPVRWKVHAIGNYHLNGISPARHAWI